MMRLLIATVLLSVGAHAQWVGYKVAGVPRMSDGKPNLTAPVPRVNGKPDLSGIWIPIPAKIGEAVGLVPVEADLAVPGDDARQMSKYFFSTLADYKLEDIMTPAGIQKWQSGGRPTPACTTDTPPMMGVIPAPQRWVQGAATSGDPKRRFTSPAGSYGWAPTACGSAAGVSRLFGGSVGS